MRKTTLIVLLFICSSSLSHAQFFKQVRTNTNDSFDDSLTQVVSVFKTNYYPIQGKQLTSQGLVDVYQSNVGVPGASHCIIQRYHSEEDTSASWQAIMYEGESFEEAVKIYRTIYKTLKKAKIKNGATSIFSFTGDLEEPNESVRFTVSPLKLNTPEDAYKYFYAEVEITSNYDGWEVHLNLHSKKNDNEQY
ncbi:MAG: hypothetical protein V4725_00150 [Bacteroidota bacterium]